MKIDMHHGFVLCLYLLNNTNKNYAQCAIGKNQRSAEKHYDSVDTVSVKRVNLNNAADHTKLVVCTMHTVTVNISKLVINKPMKVSLLVAVED